jgi:hypothetical protein
MEEIKADLKAVKNAVFGNNEDPKRQPGILRELSTLEASVKITNSTLAEMRGDQKKLLWLALAGVVGAVLRLVIMH